MPFRATASDGPPYRGPGYAKPGRALPPRVDTDAASRLPVVAGADDADVPDRPYLTPEELTPVSASPSRSPSPKTPSEGQGSLFSKLLRSVALPVPREPPSPGVLSAGLDSAFVPVPDPKLAPHRYQQGGGYGGLGQGAEPGQVYALPSPRDATAGGFLERMNTIAPGPFDGRGKVHGAPAAPGHRRHGSAGRNLSRPSAAGLPGHSRTSTHSSGGSGSGTMAARVPRKNGYGGFGPPGGEEGQREPRATEDGPRTPPARGARPEPRGGRHPSPPGPDHARDPPPRADPRLGDAPAVPSYHNPAAEYGIGNPHQNLTRSPSPDGSEDRDESRAIHVGPRAAAGVGPPLALADPQPAAPGRVAPAGRPAPAHRPTSSKGNCKGCGDAIRGKSVSSADGRLSGRYHKACFVCTACWQPFRTATFYVIDDSPYCARHYHKLNGSVCTACDGGIEGPYLESERREKFHPDCLTCADCQRSLRHDYFEIDGRVYCERDAVRRARLGPPAGGGGAGARNRMERRTTRLMGM
ncbi:hypothetical protein PZA11_004228 [Diplocarpon coronariae]